MIEVLTGLEYLHSQEPYPIIHRDIKPDNIFVYSTDAHIKIGDLGLATQKMADNSNRSVLGTSEYMAPEIYESKYDTGVDLYAFGMTFLEICTSETPYSECKGNPVKIFEKVVRKSEKPRALDLIEDPEIREFIELCISACENRPSASELLKHQ